MTVSTIQGFDETGQPDFVLERGIDRADRGADETDRRADEGVEALEAELGKPPKTPDNSSVPPSQGHKANGESETKPKAKSHVGAHRPLHPNPTRRRDVLTGRCEHCRADVSA